MKLSQKHSVPRFLIVHNTIGHSKYVLGVVLSKTKNIGHTSF